jgi:hypothetical protein
VQHAKKSLAFFTPLLLIAFAAATEQAKPSLAEQAHFSADDESVQRPGSVPEGVLQILRRDRDVLNVLKCEHLPAEQLPASWFRASETHLDGPNETDMIVIAAGPLIGANVTTFWVFRPTAQGYELVLLVATHDLSIKKHRSHGYRDILARRQTAIEFVSILYRFDGKQYQPYRTKSGPIR